MSGNCIIIQARAEPQKTALPRVTNNTSYISFFEFTQNLKRSQDLPERIILLSDTLEVPTLDNLWSYLSHFYNKVGPALKDHFSFEDQAGIYSEPGLTRLFAVCTRYPEIEGLKRLPGGRYLCADCTEENRAQILEKLTRTARTKYHTDPAFTVQLIVVSGILQWDYEIQIYIGK